MMRQCCTAALFFAVSAIACSGGDDGAEGTSVVIQQYPESPGANCERGGVRIAGGADANGNGVLDEGEATTTTYDCNSTVCQLRPYANCAGADLRDTTLLGLDLTGINLEGADLRGAVLLETFLTHANLKRARLDDVLLYVAALQRADLTDVSAKRAVLAVYISLEEANLTNADFTDAIFVENSGGLLDNVIADNAKFVSAVFDSPISMQDARFNGADFTDAQFAPGQTFDRTSFVNAKLVGVALNDVVMVAEDSTADFTGADLSYASLFGASFAGVDVAAISSFTNAYFATSDIMLPGGVDLAARGAIDTDVTDLTGRDFSRVFFPSGFSFTGKTIAGANFTGRTFNNVGFSGALAGGANFTNARFNSQNFSNVTFSGANFTGADLTSASFAGSVLIDGANFTNASLNQASVASDIAGTTFNHTSLLGTNLSAATLGSTPPNWSGCFYAGTTNFPPTVNGDAVGCVRFEQGAPTAGKDFSWLRTRTSNFSGQDFTGADFSNATLDGTFVRSNFTNANFTNATLDDARLSESNLVGANLTNAKARLTALQGVDASGANFTGADLICANLGYGSAEFTPARVVDATWDETRCPYGRMSSSTPDGTCNSALIVGGPDGNPLSTLAGIRCEVLLLDP